MTSIDDHESGFSAQDLHFARVTFYRDCPKGYCSKRKFLAFMRKSSMHATLNKTSRIHFLDTFFSRQNYRQSRKFFSMMFDIYDQNCDGQLDFDEYLYALSALSGVNRLRTIETLYNFFDINHQGFITRQEFNARKKLAAQFLGQYKTGINDHLSYDQAFNTMDTNQDGKISKEEFIQWHLKDHSTTDETKPVKKRTRLLRNLSTLVDLRGQIKTSSLQQKDQRNPVDAWLATTMNLSPSLDFQTQSSIHTDRYLLKVLRRARNRFLQHRQMRSTNDRTPHDNQSDSGVFTTSSRTTCNGDTDDDEFSSLDAEDSDNEFLCQSLEEVLMETILELRQKRQQRNSSFTSSPKNEPVFLTRL